MNWAKISLFSNLPAKVLKTLDFSGFKFPDQRIELLRQNLEQKLHHYVVSYKADICNLATPLESHLCARVKGADLTPEELKLLNIYEAISKKQNVTFVVYQKPLEYINPYQSAIAELYRKNVISHLPAKHVLTPVRVMRDPEKLAWIPGQARNDKII